MLTFANNSRLNELDDLKKEEEERLIQSLSDSYGLPYIDLRSIAPEQDAMRMMSKADAQEAELVPFKITGRKLYLGCVSPQNKRAQEIIKSLETRGSEINLFLTSHASIDHVLSRYDEVENLKKVESGEIELTEEKLGSLIKDLHSIDDVTKAFAGIRSAQNLYRTSRTIELIFAGAVALNASDVHIEPEENQTRLRYRLDGVLQDVAVIESSLSHLIANRLKILSGLKLSTTKNAQDGRFSIELGAVEFEVRVSAIPGNYGEGFVMRLLDPRNLVVKIEDMGMSKIVSDCIERALARPNGVILTTGPTGSGKSTTLYAFMQKMNSTEVKIITIEDPIEYHLEGITQTQVDEEKDYTFLSGLRAALRQDPDIIMVGEIRDEDTAKVAINAALTGHLVFSTLHTNTAAGTIPRLLDLKVNPKVIASALSLSLAQRLVRKLCPICKEEVPATDKENRLITTVLGTMITSGKSEALSGLTPQPTYNLFKAKGCDKCHNGYLGRMGIFEAILMNAEIERLVIGNPSEREIRDIASKQGIPTLREDAIIKVVLGLTSLDEVSRVVDLYEE